MIRSGGLFDVEGDFTSNRSSSDVSGRVEVGGNSLFENGSDLTVRSGGVFTTSGDTTFNDSSATIHGLLNTDGHFSASNSTVDVYGRTTVGGNSSFSNGSDLMVGLAAASPPVATSAPATAQWMCLAP